MKQKEKQQWQKSSQDELQKKIQDLTHAEATIRIHARVKPVKNSRQGRALRRDIAVLKTIVREKQLESGVEIITPEKRTHGS